MKILTDYAQTEFKIKNSRFINEIFPCTSQDEAKKIIKAQKTKHFDATHVVHAFVLGFSKEILGMSDDGEPSGTAGRPILCVMQSKDSTNFLITVTRRFGGTLLGTGGLVKSYGDGAKSVIEKAESSGFFKEYVEKKDFSFLTDYMQHKPIKRMMEEFSVSEIVEEFGTKIKVSGKIVSAEFEFFKESLKNLSNGKILI